MSEMDINQVLGQMRAMAARASGNDSPLADTEAAGRQNFAGLLKDSVDKVSEVQQQASGMAAAFEMGDPNADLAETMLALQKSSLSFQALSQVRNKLVSAYQEIMNMQV
ncbi:MAG: flagellar hook-basal body complex protein FliE [Thiohalobacterales bacterium]|nr:flagellar hook-basal body complex protein FliE [Thiohalobacterales bacterium]